MISDVLMINRVLRGLSMAAWVWVVVRYPCGNEVILLDP